MEKKDDSNTKNCSKIKTKTLFTSKTTKHIMRLDDHIKNVQHNIYKYEVMYGVGDEGDQQGRLFHIQNRLETT